MRSREEHYGATPVNPRAEKLLVAPSPLFRLGPRRATAGLPHFRALARTADRNGVQAIGIINRKMPQACAEFNASFVWGDIAETVKVDGKLFKSCRLSSPKLAHGSSHPQFNGQPSDQSSWKQCGMEVNDMYDRVLHPELHRVNARDIRCQNCGMDLGAIRCIAPIPLE